MTINFRVRFERGLRLSVGVALLMGGLGALSGCTQDPRVSAVDAAIQEAVTAHVPTLVGAKIGDLTEALKSADQGTMIVPVGFPRLDSSAHVEAISEAASVDVSTEDAASRAAASGLAAWTDWYRDNAESVEYAQVELPVSLAVEEGSDPTATVDEGQLREVSTEIAAANAAVIHATALTTPVWQGAMVSEHRSSFIPQVTGLPGAAVSSTTIKDLAPLEAGKFRVEIGHPAPSEVYAAQAEKAAESFGSGKIWEDLDEAGFAERMDRTEVSVPATQTSTATVSLVKSDREYDSGMSLDENLQAEVSRYSVTVQDGAAPAAAQAGQARTQAAASGYNKVKDRVIKPAKRPGTKKLSGAGSGSPVTIKTGRGEDRHITFIRWGSSKQVTSVFIKSGKTLSFRVPAGTYRLVYSSGKTWYGKKYSFGPSGTYREFKTGGNSAMKVKIQSNYRYTISIAVAGSGSKGGVASGTTSNPYAK